MADRQGVLAGRTGKGTRTWYNDAEWKEVPGLDNFSVAATEPTATTISAFEGSFAEVGTAEIGDVSWDIASFSPHPVWNFMDSKRISQDAVQFRVETLESVKFAPASSATVAIDTSGVLTFGGTGLGSKAGDPKDAARGMGVKVGSTIYILTSISDDTTPVFTVQAPASAVSAAGYSIVFPILRWEFSAIIKSPFEMNITREAAITSRFVVTPTQVVPLPTIQTSLTD